MSDEVWAIIVAAGQGRRYGRTKQFDLLSTRPVYEWALEGARQIADGIVLVVPANSEHDAGLQGQADRVVAGGETRSESVRNGLAAVPESASIVVVHDAARPLASARLWRTVVAEVQAGADAAVAGLPLTDTIKVVCRGVVTSTLDRDVLVSVQTPQAFRAGVLRSAHASQPEASDDAALVEAGGTQVHVVPGEPANIKLTSPDDLAFAEWHLDRRLAERNAT